MNILYYQQEEVVRKEFVTYPQLVKLIILYKIFSINKLYFYLEVLYYSINP